MIFNGRSMRNPQVQWAATARLVMSAYFSGSTRLKVSSRGEAFTTHPCAPCGYTGSVKSIAAHSQATSPVCSQAYARRKDRRPALAQVRSPRALPHPRPPVCGAFSSLNLIFGYFRVFGFSVLGLAFTSEAHGSFKFMKYSFFGAREVRTQKSRSDIQNLNLTICFAETRSPKPQRGVSATETGLLPMDLISLAQLMCLKGPCRHAPEAPELLMRPSHTGVWCFHFCPSGLLA